MGLRIIHYLFVGLCILTAQSLGQAQDAHAELKANLGDWVYLSWIDELETNSQQENCVTCHLDEGRGGVAASLNEMSRWLSSDKHAIARRRVEPVAMNDNHKASLRKRLDKVRVSEISRYTTIQLDNANELPSDAEIWDTWRGKSNLLSRQICDSLWGPKAVESREGYKKFEEQCANCHGGFGVTGKDRDAFTHPDKASIGIDCRYCHQMGENKDWIQKHPTGWLNTWPKDKETAGMRNLVSVSIQADLCFDCHIGSKDKFVTHEIYAAGHPPLPGIELETFCREMPQHWKAPADLYRTTRFKDHRDDYFSKYYPSVIDADHKAEDVSWNTRKLLIGALVARKKTVGLFADRAHSRDYALYDCSACHHELRRPSRRQERRLLDSPGRPLQHEWPRAIFPPKRMKDVLSALFDFNEDAPKAQKIKKRIETIEDLEQRLNGHFSDQPFGNPKTVEKTATDLRNEFSGLIIDMERTPMRNDGPSKLRHELGRTPAESVVTYDSARQVLWAVAVISDELAKEDDKEKVKSRVKDLARELLIDLSLPSTRHESVADWVDRNHKTRRNYDPGKLIEKLKR